MKTNYIILWAILSLTFSTLCYGQNQVRAYTLPLPLDPPNSRLAEFPSISIDSIIQTEAEDIVKEAMKDTKKNKKNDPDRLELKKYCRFCRKHTLHRETK